MTESSISPAPAAFSYPGHGPNAGIGVAICHGFTGSPLSILPWAQHLADQRLRGIGATPAGPRHPLAGPRPARLAGLVREL